MNNPSTHTSIDVDEVNRPPHYTSHSSGIECIEVVEWLPFCLGNAFKYLFRRNIKGGLRHNLEKAIWYLKREKKRAGVWVEEVLPGTVAIVRAKARDIAAYEPYNVGGAMIAIVNVATGAADDTEALDDAIALVQAEIVRVCP